MPSYHETSFAIQKISLLKSACVEMGKISKPERLHEKRSGKIRGYSLRGENDAIEGGEDETG
jgi:hypothetical protein